MGFLKIYVAYVNQMFLVRIISGRKIVFWLYEVVRSATTWTDTTFVFLTSVLREGNASLTHGIVISAVPKRELEPCFVSSQVRLHGVSSENDTALEITGYWSLTHQPSLLGHRSSDSDTQQRISQVCS